MMGAGSLNLLLGVCAISSQTVKIDSLLARLRAGDKSAQGDLLANAYESLLRLTGKLLDCSPRVKRWEQTDDVLQNAYLRLCQALCDVTPKNARHFFRLAAQHIRWEIITNS